MHAAPIKYKTRSMWRWIEENNKCMEILGIRWLLKEHRRRQVASSLVIYMNHMVEIGKRLFHTT